MKARDGIEKLAKDFYLEIANHVGLDVAFFAYQDGQMTKRKLCQLIGDWVAEVHLQKLSKLKSLLKERMPEKKETRENPYTQELHIVQGYNQALSEVHQIIDEVFGEGE